MNRGDVYWAYLPAPVGHRPVLLLSRDSMPAGRGEITVAYLTTTVRHTSVEVPLTTADGVSRLCVVNLDSINTIPISCLRGYICTLAPYKLDAVKQAILEALDLT